MSINELKKLSPRELNKFMVRVTAKEIEEILNNENIKISDYNRDTLIDILLNLIYDDNSNMIGRLRLSELIKNIIKTNKSLKEYIYDTLENRPYNSEKDIYKLIESSERISLRGIFIKMDNDNNYCKIYTTRNTLDKIIKDCIIPIAEAYDVSMNMRIQIKNYTKNAIRKRYDLISVLNRIKRAFCNYEENYIYIEEEIEYILNTLLERKLTALYNKQVKEEKKMYKN